MTEEKRTFKEKCKRVLQCIFNPRFLICFGLGWMITNGWAYVAVTLGAILKMGWMVTIGTAYLTLLWFPFTPEKIFTIAIAIQLMAKLFPYDVKTLGTLKEWKDQIKYQMKTQKARRTARKAQKRALKEQKTEQKKGEEPHPHLQPAAITRI